MSNKKSRTFTGKLTCLKRDVVTLSPKVMLKDVKDGNSKLFRDHTYIALSKKIEPLVPKTTQTEVLISFTARVYKYKGSDGITKKGLQHLRNVKVEEC